MTATPPIAAEVLAGDEKILVLAPHPDDESLACGGLLANAFAGAGAHVVCMTDGSASHPGSTDWPANKLAAKRHEELKEALTLLGGTANDLTWLGLPDSQLHGVDPAEIVVRLEEVTEREQVRHVFVPAQEDKHCDHKTTARIAGILRARRSDIQFYSYPVWSRWDDPDFANCAAAHRAVKLESHDAAARKRAAISAHRSQLGEVVQDDPEGFVLPAGFVEKFVGESEIFWRMP